MDVQKKIAFFIEKQFPAIYREYGPELVKLVEEYYRFLEEDTRQAHYNNRRIFQYRDISTTLNSMLIYFKNKYLADLPLDEENVSFLVRNILDLYNRKGTREGIILFFRIFYQEDAEIYYPAEQILKPSSSKWQTGVYLQLFPNDNLFTDVDGGEYTYADLNSRNIIGSLSGAKAAVNSVNLITINQTPTPVLFIDALQGNFTKYDDINTIIDGKLVTFGRVNGSLSGFLVNDPGGQTNIKKGSIFDVVSDSGRSGRAIVTSVSTNPTGQVEYTVENGGFGYTVENTKLIVSNQSIIMDNFERVFIPGERLRDTNGNQGIVIGQNDFSVGVLMDGTDEFVLGPNISTDDRNPNLIITNLGSQAVAINDITERNDTSPGNMFADSGLDSDVKIAPLLNPEVVSLITDPIADFLNVQLLGEDIASGGSSSNLIDYNAGANTMSGSETSPNFFTVLTDAFDLTPFNIGTIDDFLNTNPGVDYRNDVFAIARDEVMQNFDRYNQIISFDPPESASAFSVGETITEDITGVVGKILEINRENGTINVLPYSYYGFTGNDIIGSIAGQFAVFDIATDYNSNQYGDNATINSVTDFAEGRVETAAIYNSGYGYIDQAEAYLRDDAGQPVIRGQINVDSQGVTSGYWADFSSHLNGFTQTLAADGVDTYYDSNMKVQDSDFYQEFSYQIKSTLSRENYEKSLKENVHLAGTKLFSDFYFRYKQDSTLSANLSRIFNDNGKGTPLDQPDVQAITSDITNLFIDSEEITSDNDASAFGNSATYQMVVQGGLTAVDEGSTLTFIVTTTNVPNGSLYYSVPNTGDFQFTGGNVIITNGSGAFQITPLADNTTEGSEQITVNLHTGSSAGPVVGSVGPITINDTSTASAFTADYTLAIGFPGSGLYSVGGTDRNGSVSGNNQPLSFNVGDKVRFNNSVSGGHPLYVKTVQGTGTSNQAPGVAGAGTAVVDWTIAASGTYYYQCSFHNAMYGTITVT